MKLSHFLLSVCVFLGCSDEKRRGSPSRANGLDLLKTKSELYLAESQTVVDADGWILTHECDALLHNGMWQVGGADVDLTLAMDPDGEMHRRPARDCLSGGFSKSSISRDMLLGYLLALVWRKDLSGIEDFIKFAEKNDWILGDSDGSPTGINRITGTPQFQAVWYQALFELGGDEDIRRKVPQIISDVDGFQAHLQVITILIRSKLFNALEERELDRVVELTEKDPNNALFWAIRSKFTDGNQSRAVDILLRDDLFPTQRLPSSSERCNPYLWMHGEKPQDWGACADEFPDLVHPGHDLAFVSAIIFDDSFGLALVGNQ